MQTIMEISSTTINPQPEEPVPVASTSEAQTAPPVTEPKKHSEKSKEKKARPPEEPPVVPADLLARLESLSLPEKAQLLLDEIEKSLSVRPPNYKLFWDLRRYLLAFTKDPYFTENKTFWDRLHGLTSEARRLKEVLAEESAYAQEQIDLAIQAVEKELVDQEIPAEPFDPRPFEDLAQFKDNLHFYLESQGELILLNAYASRVNALRKELTKLPLRMKTKNALFDRLSALGDQIFPRRKELIQEVSDKFVADVQLFVQSIQLSKLAPRELSLVKGAIKSLQSLAKSLTLNTVAFNQTRETLSRLWDNMKGAEKEKFAERDAEREDSKKGLDDLLEQGRKIMEDWSAGAKSLNETEKSLEDLLSIGRRTRLDRFHVKDWKDSYTVLREPLDQELDKMAAERRSLDQKREAEKQDRITAFKIEIKTLRDNAKAADLEQVENDLGALTQKIANLGLSKSDKQETEKELRQIREIIRIKKEETLLSLSSDDKLKLDNLREVLETRLQRKKEIRDRLEELRKAKGATGFDFEQALLLETQIQEERQALEQINNSIGIIEEEIESLCK